jgi:hypothetical protein
MANFARQLAEGNKSFGKAVQVCRQQISNEPAASQVACLAGLLSYMPCASNTRHVHVFLSVCTACCFLAPYKPFSPTPPRLAHSLGLDLPPPKSQPHVVP